MFTDGQLVRLIVPLVVEQLLTVLIGMVDTIMVSSISESAVSAVSLVDNINVLLIALFSAMATGGTVVAAQYLGKNAWGKACSAAKQLIYGVMAIAFAAAAMVTVFCNPLLRLCFGRLPEETMTLCRTYLSISAFSYVPLAIYNAGAALLRAMGNSKASMSVSVLMNVLNVCGNAVLIYGFRLEVAGAALASLLSHIAGAVIVIRLLMNSALPLHLVHLTELELDGPMLGRIFRIGIPNGLENSMFQVGKILVMGMVSTFSVSTIAANAVSNSIAGFANLIGSAMGLAMLTVVGQCIGAEEFDQAKYYSRKLLAAIHLCGIAVYALLFFFARPLAALFNLSEEGMNTAVMLLRWFSAAAVVFWPGSFAVPNALRAAGDARFTMMVSVFSMWVFRIASSYLLVYTFKLGILGVWLAMIIDWIFRAACFWLRYCGNRWLQKRVI